MPYGKRIGAAVQKRNVILFPFFERVLVHRGHRAAAGEHSSVPGQKSLNFMMPLYLGDNEDSYPAYIHVYDEAERDPDTGMEQKETWLRICLLTDYIGAVELTCRLYEGTHLDMRLFFSSSETADEFREQIPDLKDSLRDSSLRLEEIKVGAVGERRFL